MFLCGPCLAERAKAPLEKLKGSDKWTFDTFWNTWSHSGINNNKKTGLPSLISVRKALHNSGFSSFSDFFQSKFCSTQNIFSYCQCGMAQWQSIRLRNRRSVFESRQSVKFFMENIAMLLCKVDLIWIVCGLKKINKCIAQNHYF
jgi:hypothetical protein